MKFYALLNPLLCCSPQLTGIKMQLCSKISSPFFTSSFV